MSVFEDTIFLTVAKTFRYQLLLSTQKNSPPSTSYTVNLSANEIRLGQDRL